MPAARCWSGTPHPDGKISYYNVNWTPETSRATDNTLLFAGRELDTTRACMTCVARWYDPALNRFISRDPMGYAGSPMNLYTYCGDNPLGRTDPSGMDYVVVPVCDYSVVTEQVVASGSMLVADPSFAASYAWSASVVSPLMPMIAPGDALRGAVHQYAGRLRLATDADDRSRDALRGAVRQYAGRLRLATDADDRSRATPCEGPFINMLDAYVSPLMRIIGGRGVYTGPFVNECQQQQAERASILLGTANTLWPPLVDGCGLWPTTARARQWTGGSQEENPRGAGGAERAERVARHRD